MPRDTNQPVLPNLIRERGCLIDNLFADLWQQVGMKTLLCRAGFRKRSGTPIHELIYCLMLWVWLKVDSIGLFAHESLQTFSRARKAQALDPPFRDGRSVVARRYRVARGRTKPQMARDMIARAQRNGIDAEYLLGDAWFGYQSDDSRGR